ncbi:MAG: pilus assembly protein TadG-related protein [Pseudomonadota bacterium]
MKHSSTKPEARFDASQFLYDDEEGAATVFGIFTLILMMFAAGVAIDIMRSEVDRSRLQNAIDRSVLAAAQLKQERDSRIVVEDYLRAAGIDESSVQIRPIVEIDQSTGRPISKTVTVKAVSDVPTFFMNSFGIDDLVQPISTQAIEKELNTEISLVLDVSGSMSGTKTANLKDAAKDFVEDMLKEQPELTTISVVSYDSQVNLGSQVASYFPLTNEHSLSSCVSFESSDYETLGIPKNASGEEEIQRLGHFSHNGGNSNSRGPISNGERACPKDGQDDVLAWSNNTAALKSHIDSIGAAGWTAVGKGVKMGAILLDPSARDELEAMADDGLVDEVFRGRPVDYGTDGFKKFIVVMTDGKNTDQHDLNDNVRSGLSRIYVYHPPGSEAFLSTPVSGDANGDGVVSPGEEVYPLSTEFDGAWWSGASDETYYSIWSPTKNQYWSTRQNKYVNQPDGGTDARQMTNVEVFNTMSENYIVKTLLGESDGRSGRASNDDRSWWKNTMLRTHSSGTMMGTEGRTKADEELHNICDAAKNAGIVIYSIALQAGADGEKAMEDCANDGTYYKVLKAEDLDDTFADIAAAINRLKLTQ